MPTIPNQGGAPAPGETRYDPTPDVVTTDDVPGTGAGTGADTPDAKDATRPATRTNAPKSAADAPGTERVVKGTEGSR